MKLLKFFNFSNKDKDNSGIQDIHEICKRYGIKDYVIRPDGKVDVSGSVNLNEKNLTKVPLDFGVVHGHFICDNNKLTTLEGCPKVVHGSFFCNWNKLTTLKGCPEEVHGDFDCSNNKLTSLEDCPKVADAGFMCHRNNLTSLEGCPDVIHGNFLCKHNKLTTLEHGPYEVSGVFHFYNNPLKNWKWAPEDVGGGEIEFSINKELDPVFKKFLKICYLYGKNQEIIKYILKEQSFYNIWKRDGSLNVPRFKQMMTELLKQLFKQYEQDRGTGLEGLRRAWEIFNFFNAFNDPI